MDEKKDKTIKVNSAIISAIISLPAINTLVIVRTSLGSIFTIGSILIFIFSLVVNGNIKKSQIIFTCLTCTIPLFSFLFKFTHREEVIRYFMFYFQCGILFVYAITHKINFDLVFKNILIIFTVFLSGLLYFIPVIKNHAIGFDFMSLSYMVQPVVLSSIYVAFFSNEKKSWRLFAIILFIIYFYYGLQFYTRGAFFGVVVFVLILYLIKESKTPIFYTPLKLLIILMVLIIAFNFSEFLIAFNDFLYDINFEISPISKLVTLAKIDNIDNGRMVIYKSAIEMFKQNPVLGNGLAAFRDVRNTYEHNIFLQLLNEGGILFSFVHFVLILRTIEIIINKNNRYKRDYRYFIIFLFCNSFIQLCFSSFLWSSPGYWMMIYLTFIRKDFMNNMLETEKLDEEM